MITKDGRDLPIEKLTADNYAVPAGEEMYYHAVIEVVQYNPKTGERISRPRVQKFGRKIFETSVQANLKKQGYSILILHDPRKWETEHQAEIEAQRKAAAEKAKAEEKKRFDDAVAAAVAKALAEQKPKKTTKKENI